MWVACSCGISREAAKPRREPQRFGIRYSLNTGRAADGSPRVLSFADCFPQGAAGGRFEPRMATNGHEWTRMDTNGHEWTRMEAAQVLARVLPVHFAFFALAGHGCIRQIMVCVGLCRLILGAVRDSRREFWHRGAVVVQNGVAGGRGFDIVRRGTIMGPVMSAAGVLGDRVLCRCCKKTSRCI